jgi:plastocyanin
MNVSRRWALALAGSLVGIAGLWASGATELPAAPRTWVVYVGSETMLTDTEHGKMGAWQNAKFYPADLTVAKGDTVVFRNNTTETHNVVFNPAGQGPATLFSPENGDRTKMLLNPTSVVATPSGPFDGSQAASSGMIHGMDGMAAEWSLTFTKEGDYTYVCTPHSAVIPIIGPVGMVGKVHVRGSAPAATPESVEAEALKAIASDIADDQAADPAAHQVASRRAPDGSTIWTVAAGFSSKSGGELLRFGVDDLKVKVGDTVEWVQKADQAPHTISFFSGGDETPETLTVGGKVYQNPDAAKPVGGAVYDGTGVASSGYLWGTKNPTGGPRTYSLRFTKAGHFEYICIPHDSMGMMAYVTVE